MIPQPESRSEATLEMIIQKIHHTLVMLLILIFMVTNNFAANKEARAVWVNRWNYTEGSNAANHRYKIQEIMRQLKAGTFNIVIWQMRGKGDAFYRSSIEPWASELTGILGRDPGWDPLEYAINQAHRNSLELHAWVNLYPAWKGTIPPPITSPLHVYRAHPEWVCVDNQGNPMDGNHDEYITLSPGIPEVRQYLLRLCLDIVQRYDIDGMHFDYIRYPTKKYSHDSVSVALFNCPEGNPEQLDWASWQREQVTKFVREFYAQAMALKPWLKVSAAVLGKYDYAHTGWDGYNIVYQDGKKWMKEGIMDFLAPMIYCSIGQSDPWASFESLLRDWVKKNAFDRHIYAGIGANNYMTNFQEISDEIDTCRMVGARGQVFLNYASLDGPGFWDDLKKIKYKDLANVPAMPWKDSVRPNKPQHLTACWLTPCAIQLSWNTPQVADDGDSASYYNIYRSVAKAPLDIEDPVYLYGITPNKLTTFIDTDVDSGRIYYYWISALDAADNESVVSNRVKADFSASVRVASRQQPEHLCLMQIYPNPFNPQTTIRFQISEKAGKRHLNLTIFDVLGRKVNVLIDEDRPAGNYEIIWYGDDSSGRIVPSGTYFCRLMYGEYHLTQKMQFIR